MLKASDDSNPPTRIGDVLAVSDTSLVHKRGFRNQLEHYDRELKDWIRKYGINRMIGTYNVGPKSSFQIPNILYVSHYDPTSDIFTHVEQEIDLAALHAAVLDATAKADQWVATSRARKP